METQLQRQYLPSPWARYGVAAALLSLALAARMVLLPVEARLAFATFYPVVVLSFYLCGIGPGALVSVLSAAAGVYFFSPPYYSWGVDFASLLAATAFLFASAMTGRLRRPDARGLPAGLASRPPPFSAAQSETAPTIRGHWDPMSAIPLRCIAAGSRNAALR